MSITFSTKINSSFSIDVANGKATGSYTHLVTTTNDETPTQIYLASPYSGNVFVDGYPIKTFDLARLDQDKAHRWILTVNYGSPDDQDNSDTNPLNEPVVWSVSSQSYQQAIDRDISGKPLFNSAGDPFEDIIERDQSRMIFNAEKNVASINFLQLGEMVDTLNRSSWNGLPVGTVKLQGYSASQDKAKINNGPEFTYWKISYQFAYRKEGWQEKILNAGYRYRDTEAEPVKLKPILVDGKKTDVPLPLDIAGQVLADPINDTPTYLDFDLYLKTNFDALGLTYA